MNVSIRILLQDFELRKVLGKGGYGKVFQVKLRNLYFFLHKLGSVGFLFGFSKYKTS